jgi:hypothetical protein
MQMRREEIRSLAWAGLLTAIVALLIVVGSRKLARFDAALVAYTFASLFAVFGITYRYAMWLQRPPTALFWRRGWQVFFRPAHLGRNLVIWAQRVGGQFALNDFIFKRDRLRWLAHVSIMWGCITAAAITFPLVFGWLQFDSLVDRVGWYRVVVFGVPTVSFAADSWIGFFTFHGLVWSALLVMAGVMLAFRRRMRDEGAAAVQLFSEDFLPLLLLFAVCLTGLLLTVSYTWLKGYGYEFLSLVHAVTVIFTLLWLPFGKFFHIFQRPAQLGVEFYKDAAARGEPAHCRRCSHSFASLMHVTDLIRIERELGYRYDVADPAVEHYQWICPPCRRSTLALAQGRLTAGGTSAPAALPRPAPVFANPGLGEGPLGEEDRRNFHP